MREIIGSKDAQKKGITLIMKCTLKGLEQLTDDS